VPLVVVMRDVLGLVKSKKELRKAINEKQITLNGKEVRETNYPVSLFDVIGVVSMKKSFKAVLNVSKKLVFEEVSGKDAESKVFKVIGKKVLDKGKVQVNLLHGNNVLVKDKEKVKVGDSLVVGFDGKVVKVIAMEKGHVGYVTHGKHTGHRGKIEEIVVRGGKRLAQIKENVEKGSASKDAEKHKGEKITVWVKNVIVVE
jgi:small subunit ribosomal protein S4e